MRTSGGVVYTQRESKAWPRTSFPRRNLQNLRHLSTRPGWSITSSILVFNRRLFESSPPSFTSTSVRSAKSKPVPEKLAPARQSSCGWGDSSRREVVCRKSLCWRQGGQGEGPHRPGRSGETGPDAEDDHGLGGAAEGVQQHAQLAHHHHVTR